jgi:hypothetical protein
VRGPGGAFGGQFFGLGVFFCQAFSMAFQSTPSWLTKPSSSEAITARLRWPLICA